MALDGEDTRKGVRDRSSSIKIYEQYILDFENNGTVTDPWGNKRVGLAFSGKINRGDFGLKYNSVLEAGGVMIGEKVKLDIELEGILAK